MPPLVLVHHGHQVIRTAGGQLEHHQGRAYRVHLRAWHAGKVSTLTQEHCPPESLSSTPTLIFH